MMPHRPIARSAAILLPGVLLGVVAVATNPRPPATGKIEAAFSGDPGPRRAPGEPPIARLGAHGEDGSGQLRPGALVPAPHFSFASFAVATGIGPVGSPDAVPGAPVPAYQTAVAQRAIQPYETPNAVPRTPLAAYQTAVAQRAIQPNETPNAVTSLSPVVIAVPSSTPLVPLPLLPGPLP